MYSRGSGLRSLALIWRSGCFVPNPDRRSTSLPKPPLRPRVVLAPPRSIAHITPFIDQEKPDPAKFAPNARTTPVPSRKGGAAQKRGEFTTARRHARARAPHAMRR